MAERRLLLVEDSPTMRKVMRRYLQSSGYLIFEAGDGEEALTLAARERPDVILLDLQIPILDGYGVLAALQTDPELGDVPVVLVTARAQPEDVAEGLSRGAHDYLRKPFEKPELLARVHAAMRTKTLRDELRSRNAQLERLVTTDPLTGLLNRGAAGEHLRAMVSRSERHGTELSLLLFDLEDFRRVNATHGHKAGDAVLCVVADRLRDALREEDVAGRWGGDELVVIAPDTGSDGAEALRARLCEAVAGAPCAIAGQEIRIGVTGAVASFGAGDATEALVGRVEDALAATRARRGAGPASDHRDIPRSDEP